MFLSGLNALIVALNKSIFSKRVLFNPFLPILSQLWKLTSVCYDTMWLVVSPVVCSFTWQRGASPGVPPCRRHWCRVWTETNEHISKWQSLLASAGTMTEAKEAVLSQQWFVTGLGSKDKWWHQIRKHFYLLFYFSLKNCGCWPQKLQMLLGCVGCRTFLCVAVWKWIRFWVS